MNNVTKPADNLMRLISSWENDGDSGHFLALYVVRNFPLTIQGEHKWKSC